MRDPYEQSREEMAVGEQYAYEGEPGLEPIVLADECPECGHTATHGRYGCEHERGDAWVTGNQPEEPTVLMAMGPCGCKYNEAEAALKAYAAAVKRYGKALTQLGRGCD